jgi:DNA-directed RNA polymerase specialized sigma24 family protein
VDQNDSLVARFEEHRPHLKSVAYRMLGSLAEADDAVQEAWLRVTRADTAAVDNLGGWLTTVVARICLNVLRSRHREVPLDVHVPDPVLARLDGGAPDPEQEALLADSVGLALLRRAGDAEPGGAARLRAARHVLDAVRRDRPRPGPE